MNKKVNKKTVAQIYRNKYSYWSAGFWNMNNISNRQAINIGRMLDNKRDEQ